jgi:glycosyltransferase involved in cell wall biosynthesis
VLVLHPSDEFYGADRMLLVVLESLSTLVEPLVVLPDDAAPGPLSEALHAIGIETRRLPLIVIRRRYATPSGLARLAWRSTQSVIGMARLARRWNADVIYSNTATIPIGGIVSWLVRRPHVWHIHEITQSPRWFARVVGLLSHVGRTRVVAISEAVAAWLDAGGSVDPTVLLNPAPDIPARPIPQSEPVRVLMMGRVNGWKGHDVFLDAAEALHAKGREAEFRLVGGPVPGRPEPYERVRARVARIDPTGSWLTFAGWSSKPLDEIAGSRIVVLPSTEPEPLNITALEAMAVGRPVVASRIGGLPEVVADGVTGILVEPRDPSSLANAIDRLLMDESLAEEMGRRGHERARDRHSVADYAAEWRHLIGQVAGWDPGAIGKSSGQA